MSLRFRYRHVHATMFDYVKAQLVTLGWGDAHLGDNDPANASVNFATVPATYIDFQPDEAGAKIEANTIAITLGDEPPTEDWELGGGLREIEYVTFVDIYGANQAVAQSLASDIKDLFDDVYLHVKDHTTSPATDTVEQIELDKEDCFVEKPAAALTAQDFKRYWRVVKTITRVYTPGG